MRHVLSLIICLLALFAFTSSAAAAMSEDEKSALDMARQKLDEIKQEYAAAKKIADKIRRTSKRVASTDPQFGPNEKIPSGGGEDSQTSECYRNKRAMENDQGELVNYMMRLGGSNLSPEARAEFDKLDKEAIPWLKIKVDCE